MTVADQVIVELEAKNGTYNASVKGSASVFEASMARIGRSAQNTERQVARSQDGIKRAILGATTALTSIAGANTIARLADGYTRFTNSLKVAGLEGNNLAQVQTQLFDIAQRYGVELEGLGALYGRLSQGAKELGANQADLIRFSAGVAAAVKVQGGSAEQSRGAILQLTQALGGAVVRAEEFNSINEGARPILQAVANNIERYSGSVSQLRADVIQGKVTSQEFFQAFLAGSAQLEQQATSANTTIAQSFTILNNALGKYIGDQDQAYSLTARFAGAIKSLADNLDVIIPALTVIATTLLGAYIGRTVAASAATIAEADASIMAARAQAALAASMAEATGMMTVETGAAIRLAAAQTGVAGAAGRAGAGMLAAFGGPIGLIVTGLAVGVGLLAARYNDAAVQARAVQGAHETLDPVLATVKTNLDKAAAAAGDLRQEYLRLADSGYTAAEAMLAVARVRLAEAKGRAAAVVTAPNMTGDPALDNGQMDPAGALALRQAEADVKAQEDALIASGLYRRDGRRGELARIRLRPGNAPATNPPVVSTASSSSSGPGLTVGDMQEADTSRGYDANDLRGFELEIRQSEQFKNDFQEISDQFVEANRQATDQWRYGVRSLLESLKEGHIWEDLGERIANRALDNLADKLGSLLQNLASGSGPWADLAKGVGWLFGRASGGNVVGGRPYMVGEKRPEVFVPAQSGRIVQQDQVSGGGAMGGLTVNVFANDSVLAETVRGWVQEAVAVGRQGDIMTYAAARGAVHSDLRRQANRSMGGR